MTEDKDAEHIASTIDIQVEQFVAAFSDIRRLIGMDFKRAHQQGFSATQFMVMRLIGKALAGECCTIGSIALRLGINPATVVRTVDSLEKRGLVERRRDEHDRRQVFVEFTATGHIVRQEMLNRFKAQMKAILGTMSEEGRISLLIGLDEFVHAGRTAMELKKDD